MMTFRNSNGFIDNVFDSQFEDYKSLYSVFEGICLNYKL